MPKKSVDIYITTVTDCLPSTGMGFCWRRQALVSTLTVI